MFWCDSAKLNVKEEQGENEYGKQKDIRVQCDVIANWMTLAPIYFFLICTFYIYYLSTHAHTHISIETHSVNT